MPESLKSNENEQRETGTLSSLILNNIVNIGIVLQNNTSTINLLRFQFSLSQLCGVIALTMLFLVLAWGTSGGIKSASSG